MKPHINRVVNDTISKVISGIISFDVYTLIIMLICSVLAVVYYQWVPNSSSILVLNLLIAVTVGALIVVRATSDFKLFGMLRRFYMVPVIYLMYDQIQMFVRVVNPVDYDDLLIGIDRAIFGVDPTVWLAHFSSPFLTEYLQACYFLFYLLPIMQAVELWRKGDVARLDVFTRGMAFCYFISYVAYFVMPAVGPRFTLHDYAMLDTDLPGVLLTPWLRDMIDVGGGIARGVAHPVSVVNRDCMPSGHTMLTLVNIIFGFRFRSRFRWVFLIIGGSLIFSTVYLRYHYVIDIIVGALLAIIVLPLEPVANAFIKRRIRVLQKP
ncbi:MAG: phosphatase PAP2 family protein [Ignavibacteria bacterium]|nr:phosphatase PAP2 family protein [Ignavibacteria bacterium]